MEATSFNGHVYHVLRVYNNKDTGKRSMVIFSPEVCGTLTIKADGNAIFFHTNLEDLHAQVDIRRSMVGEVYEIAEDLVTDKQHFILYGNSNARYFMKVFGNDLAKVCKTLKDAYRDRVKMYRSRATKEAGSGGVGAQTSDDSNPPLDSKYDKG